MKRIALIALLVAAPLNAQSAGKTGAQVLQFNAGARAAALSGAYTSASNDADALFYNPAGMAARPAGASAAYETFANDVVFGSAAGFTRFGGVSIGASISYLDAGSIQEVIPDPDFSGNTGTATGKTFGASESAARISLALPLRSPRLRIGASAGLVSSSVAEVSQHAALADVGAQYDVAGMTLAAALRNFGGSMSGASADPLPTEARIGAMLPFTNARGLGATFFADGIARLQESSLLLAAGVEAGLMPRGPADIGAVARIGIDTEANQLARIRFGAGLTLHGISVDYAYQSFDFLGSVHRIGIRWTARD